MWNGCSIWFSSVRLAIRKSTGRVTRNADYGFPLMSSQLGRVCSSRRKARDWDNIPQASMKRARRTYSHLSTSARFPFSDHDVRTRRAHAPIPQLQALIPTLDRAPAVKASAGSLSQAATPLRIEHRQRGLSNVDGQNKRARERHLAQAPCPQGKPTPETSRHVCFVCREHGSEDEPCSKSCLHFALLVTGACYHTHYSRMAWYRLGLRPGCRV